MKKIRIVKYGKKIFPFFCDLINENKRQHVDILRGRCQRLAIDAEKQAGQIVPTDPPVYQLKVLAHELENVEYPEGYGIYFVCRDNAVLILKIEHVTNAFENGGF